MTDGAPDWPGMMERLRRAYAPSLGAAGGQGGASDPVPQDRAPGGLQGGASDPVPQDRAPGGLQGAPEGRADAAAGAAGAPGAALARPLGTGDGTGTPMPFATPGDAQRAAADDPALLRDLAAERVAIMAEAGVPEAEIRAHVLRAFGLRIRLDPRKK